MIIKKVKLIPIHPYAYRHKDSKDGGFIIGISNVKPKENSDFRLCYSIEYQDGFIDYVPVSEVELGNWIIG